MVGSVLIGFTLQLTASDQFERSGIVYLQGAPSVRETNQVRKEMRSMKKNVIVFTVVGVVVGFALGIALMAILSTGGRGVEDGADAFIEKPYQECDINQTGEGYDIEYFSTVIEGFTTYDTPSSVISHEFTYITEDENGRTDVYVYDIDADKHTRITDSDVVETGAVLSKDYVFYSILSEDEEDSLYVYDRHTSEVSFIDHATLLQKSSLFTNGVLVYVVTDSYTSHRELFVEKSFIKAYDPVNDRIETLTNFNGAVSERIIADGSRIVWADKRNINLDVFMYDLENGKEITICDAKGDQSQPSIAGDLIVWEDHRNDYGTGDMWSYSHESNHDNGDIYGYVISRRTEIGIDTTVGESAYLPQISHNPLNNTLNCVYSVSDSGNGFIDNTYNMVTFSLPLPSKPVTKKIVPWVSAKLGPFIYGNWVSWTDFVTKDAEYPNNSDTFIYSIFDDEIIHIESSKGGSLYGIVFDDVVLITGCGDTLYGAIISRSAQ